MTRRAKNDEMAIRAEIIRFCLRMSAEGINQGTSGNISVRLGDGLLITPTSLPYETMTPEDIVHIDAEGEARGIRQPSSEWRFHHDILKHRPEVNAVLHAHPLHCTTLAILRKAIPPLHYMIVVGGGSDIRCSPYALYGSPELSAHALKALEGRMACLLGHHGMIALGSGLEQALWRAIEVETLAAQYLGCLQLGAEPPLLSEAEVREVLEKASGYGLLGKEKSRGDGS